MIPPSALLNRTFRRIWLASLVSGTAVAAHETAATWTMNLMSPSGLFISLMASLASLPFFLFTLPAGALADAFNEARHGATTQHINLLGEYDFSDEKLRDSVGIRPQKLTP
jgi:MFS family permease